MSPSIAPGVKAPSPVLAPLLVAAAILVILLSAFLPALWLGSLPLSGVSESGLAEPRRWAVAAGLAVLMAGWCWRRGPWVWVLASGLTGAIALFCLRAAALPDWLGMAELALLLVLLTLAGQALGWRRWRHAAVLLLMAGGLLADGSDHPRARQADIRAGLMTALPLFWHETGASGGSLLQGRDQFWLDASALALRPVDVLDAASLAGIDHLLLAQPRLLQPAELVVLDRWVRDGGRLVILADPLLVWSLDLPVGHRLRPPLTSLLDPLLAHWGLELLPARNAAIDRRLLPDGRVLVLAGASRFRRVGGGCRLEQNGLMALCRLGQGQARLIADADLLDDRLWLAARGRPLLPSAHAADTVTLIDHWLLDPVGGAPDLRRGRISDPQSLQSGLRWALLAGLGWVWLGILLVGRRQLVGRAGNRLGKTGK